MVYILNHYLDLDNFKTFLKNNFTLLQIDSKSVEHEPMELIEKDHEYLKTKIDVSFLAEKCYEGNISNIINNAQTDPSKFYKCKSFEVKIVNNDGEIIQNNSFKNMILPINSELIYIDDQYYNKKW